MPEVLQHLLCGRIVEIKTEAGGTLEGEVSDSLHSPIGATHITLILASMVAMPSNKN